MRCGIVRGDRDRDLEWKLLEEDESRLRDWDEWLDGDHLLL